MAIPEIYEPGQHDWIIGMFKLSEIAVCSNTHTQHLRERIHAPRVIRENQATDYLIEGIPIAITITMMSKLPHLTIRIRVSCVE